MITDRPRATAPLAADDETEQRGNSAAWPPLATSEPPPSTGSSRPSTTSRLPTPARRPPSCSAGYAATSPMSFSSWRRAKPWPSTGGCWSRAAGCRCSPRRARSTCDGGTPHRPGCARPRSSPARPVTPRRPRGAWKPGPGSCSRSATTRPPGSRRSVRRAVPRRDPRLPAAHARPARAPLPAGPGQVRRVHGDHAVLARRPRDAPPPASLTRRPGRRCRRSRPPTRTSCRPAG